MSIALMLLVPLCAAGAILLVRKSFFSKIVLAATAVTQFVLALSCRNQTQVLQLTSKISFALDEMGSLVLNISSLLFLVVSFYVIFWLPTEKKAALLRNNNHGEMGENIFCALMIFFLFTMTLATTAQDFGMLWVAVEASTLASAPLVNYHRTANSLEAMWKYLLICSLGIGLALFGTMLLYVAIPGTETLNFKVLSVLSSSGKVDLPWFKAAFVFFLAGYGLKMGLAPFHTWLPDAHSEAPVAEAALLSGALLNCVMLAILRVIGITPVELLDFTMAFLKFFGIFSLAVAAFFIVRQKDYRRLLAYSSVENIGLIVLLFAFDQKDFAMLHMVGHSLCKMTLFLIAGNILLSCNVRTISGVKGLFSRLPLNGALWLLTLLAICGTPPSPLFFSEFMLVKSAGVLWGSVILLLLFIIFCAMADTALKMCMGGNDKSGLLPEIDAKVEKMALIPAFSLTLAVVCGVSVALSWIN